MATGLERVVAAANGQKVDRIPFFCNLLDQGAAHLGMSLEEYYSKGEHVATAQLLMREKYGHDNVWSLFYVGKEAELMGCRDIEYYDDGPPNVRELIIQSAADIEALEVPDRLEDHPAFAETAACLELLKQEVGGRQPICAYLTGSMTLPAMLMGMDKWMELLLIGPASLRDELLTKCSDFFRKEIAAYRAAGADILLYSNPFGSTDILPRSMLTKVAMPWMERDLAPGGPSGVVYYAGTHRIGDLVDEVIERLGVTTFYFSPYDDLSKCCADVGDRGLPCGVLNDIPLVDASPSQVRDQVQEILRAGMGDGRFLFGTAVMPLAIPEANIRAIGEAVHDFGSW